MAKKLSNEEYFEVNKKLPDKVRSWIRFKSRISNFFMKLPILGVYVAIGVAAANRFLIDFDMDPVKSLAIIGGSIGLALVAGITGIVISKWYVYCPLCGFDLKPDKAGNKLCPYCGAIFDKESNIPLADGTDEADRKKYLISLLPKNKKLREDSDDNFYIGKLDLLNVADSIYGTDMYDITEMYKDYIEGKCDIHEASARYMKRKVKREEDAIRAQLEVDTDKESVFAEYYPKWNNYLANDEEIGKYHGYANVMSKLGKINAFLMIVPPILVLLLIIVVSMLVPSQEVLSKIFIGSILFLCMLYVFGIFLSDKTFRFIAKKKGYDNHCPICGEENNTSHFAACPHCLKILIPSTKIPHYNRSSKDQRVALINSLLPEDELASAYEVYTDYVNGKRSTDECYYRFNNDMKKIEARVQASLAKKAAKMNQTETVDKELEEYKKDSSTNVEQQK